MNKFGKLVLMTVLAGTLLVTMTGCGGDASAGSADAGAASGDKPIAIRIGHDSSTETPSHKALLEFETAVEEQTEGRIDIQIFPNSQLGTFADLFDQTRRGDIEMALTNSSNLTPTIDEFAVWESFYMFDDAAHAHRVLDGKAGKEMMKPLEKMGLTGLGYMEIGFRNFSNGKQAIETLEDVKGLKIRGYNPIQIKAWESLNVSLTNLAWAEVFSSLQQNLIDGQECATTSFVTAKFYEAQDFWSLTKHIYTNYIWYANTEFMDSLAPEDRAIIEDLAQVAVERERELMGIQEEETLAKLPELGIKINEVPVEERQKMGKIMNGAIKEDIIAKCGQDVYDLVMAEVEAERQ